MKCFKFYTYNWKQFWFLVAQLPNLNFYNNLYKFFVNQIIVNYYLTIHDYNYVKKIFYYMAQITMQYYIHDLLCNSFIKILIDFA